VIEAWSK